MFDLTLGFTCLDSTHRMLTQGCTAPFTCLGVFMLDVLFYCFTQVFTLNHVCLYFYFLLTLSFTYFYWFLLRFFYSFYPFTRHLPELLLQLLLFTFLFLRSFHLLFFKLSLTSTPCLCHFTYFNLDASSFYCF